MSTRSQRDKAKKQQELFQGILRRLLLEEDNKYCADCDAKGPRWASWNVGIFLCIRCAGIHRNLGVHISKVKSINLDTWTEKQTLSIEGLGNRHARKLYEAHLPTSFRRPQNDYALEHFIRAKYEHKKYIDKELAAKLKEKNETQTAESIRKTKSSQEKPVTLQKLAKTPTAAITKKSPVKESPVTIDANAFQEFKSAPPASPTKVQNSMDDLLGLDTPKITNNNDDLFSISITQEVPTQVAHTVMQLTNSSPPEDLASNTSPTHQAGPPLMTNGTENDVDLFGSDVASNSTGQTSKESILALFGSQSNQKQMYNVPGGMYIPSQQPNPAQMGNNFVQQPQQVQPMMMNQSPAYQQKGMVGVPAAGSQNGMVGVNMGYSPANSLQQQQSYLQQWQANQSQSSPQRSPMGNIVAQTPYNPTNSMHIQQQPQNMHFQQVPQNMHIQQQPQNMHIHQQPQNMHQQQYADPKMMWQKQSQSQIARQQLNCNIPWGQQPMPIQQRQNMYMQQSPVHRGVTYPTNQPATMERQFMNIQQQPDVTQVQTQMQNMRVTGTVGPNEQLPQQKLPQQQLPQQLPQQQLPQQQLPQQQLPQQQLPQQQLPQQQLPPQQQQAWNGGMYPTMQQTGVPVQGSMGWQSNMGSGAGQTLSTQLWK